MPYRIRKLDTELYKELARAWMLSGHNMVDMLRDVDNLDRVLEHPQCVFYKTKEPVFFWLSSVTPGHQAEFHVLNSIGKKAADNLGQYFPVLREIFTDFNLQRLTVVIPAKLKVLSDYTKRLKFQSEGIMRKGLIFNGEFEDAEILGLLRENIPPREKRPRQRHKTRRKRPKASRAKKQNQTEKKAA